MTPKDVTPAVKSAVNAYLMARTHAELLREKVDKMWVLFLWPPACRSRHD
jgi:hypothetical protein